MSKLDLRACYLSFSWSTLPMVLVSRREPITYWYASFDFSQFTHIQITLIWWHHIFGFLCYIFFEISHRFVTLAFFPLLNRITKARLCTCRWVPLYWRKRRLADLFVLFVNGSLISMNFIHSWHAHINCSRGRTTTDNYIQAFILLLPSICSSSFILHVLTQLFIQPHRRYISPFIHSLTLKQ